VQRHKAGGADVTGGPQGRRDAGRCEPDRDGRTPDGRTPDGTDRLDRRRGGSTDRDATGRDDIRRDDTGRAVGERDDHAPDGTDREDTGRDGGGRDGSTCGAWHDSEAWAAEDGIPVLHSRVAVAVFRLNGQFLARSEDVARPVGLTAARWQVLGAVLCEPAPVSGIARTMGITRQSVQRIADTLVEAGLAEYRPNPAHRRAKLLALTAEGAAALRKLAPLHWEFADGLVQEIGGAEELTQVLEALESLSKALDALEQRTGRTRNR
jgi:DNA-binding MarR family transcriptional regulator